MCMTDLTAVIGRCLSVSFVLLKVYEFEPLFLDLHTKELGTSSYVGTCVVEVPLALGLQRVLFSDWSCLVSGGSAG